MIFDLKIVLTFQPIRSFSGAIQSIEQLRVTFPVGSIPARVVLRSSQNLFTVYNSRSAQIINTIPLSPDVRKYFLFFNKSNLCSLQRIIINDFVYDTAGEILYILTSKTGENLFVFLNFEIYIYILVCSYYCASQPSYLLNIFEVNDECLFTKLCCIMQVRIEYRINN